MTPNMLDMIDPREAIAKSECLKAAGIRAVAAYYVPTGAHSIKTPLTAEIATELAARGFKVVSLLEIGPSNGPDCFSAAQGNFNGHVAFSSASDAKQPPGTPIIECIDYDAQPSDEAAITAHFSALRDVLIAEAAAAGIERYGLWAYGNGWALGMLTEKGLISGSMLSESTAFLDSAAWRPHADVLQLLDTVVCGISCDTNIIAGTDPGWTPAA
jgi:hypothetical protein